MTEAAAGGQAAERRRPRQDNPLAAAAKPWRDGSTAPHLRIVDVVKRFGDTTAVDHVSLDIYGSEFFALLGPSGCGKTTLLRMLAGFETPDAGQILLDGEDLSRIPPFERPVNMMFQSYALFPHMTVERNIAFGLEMEGMGKAAQKERVEEMLALTHLERFARRKPDQLSGGQRQRVALARALAKKPKLLLLDEPLGALDRKLREATQFELVTIQEELGLTFVIVTHDQEEAMTVSTRIAVMREGQVAQLGEPREVYEKPHDRYVAEFIGDVNIFEGSAAGGAVQLGAGASLRARGTDGLAEGTAAAIAIRPEKISIARGDADGVGENRLIGVVEDIAYLGDVSVYHVRLPGAGVVKATRTNRVRGEEGEITWEEPVTLSWDVSAGVLLAA
ncbi:MAG: ABC transporter ATP-binding protein [Pseudomonadota bacterium]